MRLAVSTAVLLAACCVPVVAQTGGGSRLVVLESTASVRSMGMHGAGVALLGNAGSVFINPAGLATIRHIAVEGAYQPKPGGGQLTMAAGAWRLAQFDLGFGMRFFGAGDAATGAPTNSSELLTVGSLVYRFGLIALGVSGKHVTEKVAGVRQRGVSGDWGLAIAVFDIMALAFSMQNIGGNWSSESTVEMPRLTRGGFTMNYVDPQGTFRLMSTIELQWPQGAGHRALFGAEAGVVLGGVGVVGRIAHRSRPGGSTEPALTYGATFELTKINFDFAYEPNDIDEEASHRVGLRIAF
jgi:hypothetical protein